MPIEQDSQRETEEDAGEHAPAGAEGVSEVKITAGRAPPDHEAERHGCGGEQKPVAEAAMRKAERQIGRELGREAPGWPDQPFRAG